jgi:perosamine synthetase
MRIPLSAPDVREEEIDAVVGVLRTPHLSLGPKLQEFEGDVARYVGSSFGIGVSSGTAGLHLCIRALGIGGGDEVIVPSFTFVAVANAVRYENAIPVFIDVEPVTLNMDPSRIEAAITPRTKAILITHTFGCPADLPAILEIARRHQLYVIEDACEALGAEYDNRKVGSQGDLGVFAFYPNKQITTGEGGVVVTSNARIAAKVRALSNQGRSDTEDWFQHQEIGYNYRLSELNCALGISQLKRIEAIVMRREQIAKKYDATLKARQGLKLPPIVSPRRRISWFVYVIRLSKSCTKIHRDWIVKEMNRRGIGCGRYFAPIHLQPAYRSVTFSSQTLIVTESEAPRCLALPFFNRLSDEQIEEICYNLCELVG